jgi:hypothetical protein
MTKIWGSFFMEEKKGVIAGIIGVVLMVGCCAGLPLIIAAGGFGVIAAWFSDSAAILSVVGLVAALLVLLVSRRHFNRIAERRQD